MQLRPLSELAPEPKHLVPLAGAGHHDLVLVGGGRYLAVWWEFLAETAPPRSRMTAWRVYSVHWKASAYHMLNRTQTLVLSFVLLAWASLVVILLAAPEVYEQALRLPPGGGRLAGLVFLAGLSAFLVLVSAGVVRRWRWTFWLLLVAFLAGVLRVPTSLLELAGLLPAAGPIWYMLFQALLGLVQFALGLAMLAGYRRAGAWAAF